MSSSDGETDQVATKKAAATVVKKESSSGKGRGKGPGKAIERKRLPDGSVPKNKSMSARSGLLFSAGRMHGIIHKGRYLKRIGKGAPIYAAAVLEYVAKEVLDLAVGEAERVGKHTVKPRHIQLATSKDEELARVTRGFIISKGGVNPHIPPQLLRRKTASRRSRRAPRAAAAAIAVTAADAE
jgi:histone H2A